MMEKIKLEMEYLIRTSDHILYNRISTPGGLEQWFANKVTVNNHEYTFYWEGEERKARLTASKKDQLVRFHWIDDEAEKTFFEIRLKKDEMTGEMALIVTDFCDTGDVEETEMLWNSSLEKLRRVIGG